VEDVVFAFTVTWRAVGNVIPELRSQVLRHAPRVSAKARLVELAEPATIV
jgi:hypothetical protein